ncbi:transmembrane protein 232 [Biomphalaria glabrata]|uniref:Transmembrane protein 232-like n=1 Tax=Biomphalaria glabrata TaxID=6526 RepID=A0A9U8DYZ3_BIOGL|nr:transmembrane protein 232-like [Biomphalaria glabrata]KAI8756460.1 transmembrane protein 232-like [Biomphalaria glabrata]
MPFTKVPVVHKFGIISASQRLELQERLLKQTFLKSNVGKRAATVHRNDFIISEEFINCFNNAVSFKEKEKYEERARKMLERAKRRSGVKTLGQGNHVDIALAWTEMAQLAQCKGRIQDECLDALIISLDISPLEKYHITALFYLAETALYWLRTDSVNQPFLRTNEIKILKMGQLVFERLFYHHMAGQLQLYGESKMRLSTYIEGLQNFQQLYDPYPNALLSLRFVIEVGKIILADMTSATTELKEENKMSQKQNKEELSHTVKSLPDKQSQEDNHSVWSAAISCSVHDLSPTLWHALDVWRCTNGVSGGHQDALKALAHCGLGLASETWIDGTVAIQILGNAASLDIDALNVLFLLARGVRYIEDTALTEMSQPKASEGEFNLNSQFLSDPSITSSLSDIDEEGEISMDSKNNSGKTLQKPEKVTKSNDTDKFHNRESGSDSANGATTSDQVGDAKEENNQETNNRISTEKEEKSDLTNVSVSEVPGILGWQWEVAITYVEVLADIVINGTSAAIQKSALLGSNEDVTAIMYKGAKCIPFESPCHSAGLLDLVFFRLKDNEDGIDWSWRVRYQAIQALTNVSHILTKDPLREGMCTTVRSVLLKANAIEKDLRVLEAMKVGQIQTDRRKFIDLKQGERCPNIGNQIASCLSAIYLPPIPPPVAEPTNKQTADEVQGHPKRAAHFVQKEKETKPLRTSIKQEIQLASPFVDKIPDYNTRKSFDLRRIVEDQWRKELQSSLAEAEEEKLKQMLETKRKEEIRLHKVPSDVSISSNTLFNEVTE